MVTEEEARSLLALVADQVLVASTGCVVLKCVVTKTHERPHQCGVLCHRLVLRQAAGCVWVTIVDTAGEPVAVSNGEALLIVICLRFNCVLSRSSVGIERDGTGVATIWKICVATWRDSARASLGHIRGNVTLTHAVSRCSAGLDLVVTFVADSALATARLIPNDDTGSPPLVTRSELVAVTEVGAVSVCTRGVDITAVVQLETLIDVPACTIREFTDTNLSVADSADGARSAVATATVAVISSAGLFNRVVALACVRARCVSADGISITPVSAVLTLVTIVLAVLEGIAAVTIVAVAGEAIGAQVFACAVFGITGIGVTVIHVLAYFNTITTHTIDAAAEEGARDVYTLSESVAVVRVGDALVNVVVTVEVHPAGLALTRIQMNTLVGADTVGAWERSTVINISALVISIASPTLGALARITRVVISLFLENKVTLALGVSLYSTTHVNVDTDNTLTLVGATVCVVAAFVYVTAAVRVLPANVACALPVIHTEVSAETVVAASVRLTVINITAVEAIASIPVVARTYVSVYPFACSGRLFVNAPSVFVALVCTGLCITLVHIHVAVGINPSGPASAEVGVRPSVTALTVLARAIVPLNFITIVVSVSGGNEVVQSLVTVVDINATPLFSCRVRCTTNSPLFGLEVSCTMTITSPAGVTHAVVAARIIKASGFIVTHVHTHHALVPVGTACGSAPAGDTVAQETQSTTVIACTTMCAWGELAVICVNADVAITSPAKVASALIASVSVGASSRNRVSTQGRAHTVLRSHSALVDVNFTVRALPSVHTVANVAGNRSAVNHTAWAARAVAGSTILARLRSTIIDVIATLIIHTILFSLTHGYTIIKECLNFDGAAQVVSTTRVDRLPVLVAQAAEAAESVDTLRVDITVVRSIFALVNISRAVTTNPSNGQASGSHRAFTAPAIRHTNGVDAYAAILAWSGGAVIDISA